MESRKVGAGLSEPKHRSHRLPFATAWRAFHGYREEKLAVSLSSRRRGWVSSTDVRIEHSEFSRAIVPTQREARGVAASRKFERNTTPYGLTGGRVLPPMTRLISIISALLVLAAPATAGAAGPHPNGPIVFAGATAKQGRGLWAWEAGRKAPRQITSNPTDGDPQGSPDGRWIVFTRLGTTPGGVPSSTDVFLARTDGSKVAQVTSGHSDRSPSFSPSGKRILFARAEIGLGRDSAPKPDSAEELTPEHIYSMRLDGTDLQQLTTGYFSDRNPVFSPNGKVIAFERCPLSQGCHLFTMRPNGSGLRAATPNLAAWSTEPAFSPTGNRIVFLRGHPDSPNSALFTMRPDGTGVRKLFGPTGHRFGGVSSPSWSPDGTRIVFQDTGAKSSTLQVIPVRDRRLGAPLGGAAFHQLPYWRTPAWLRR